MTDVLGWYMIELKKRFTKKPVLTALDLNKTIKIEVNVLDYTMEGVLSMEYKDGW